MAKLQEKIDAKTEELENLKKEYKEAKKNKDANAEKKKSKLTKIMVTMADFTPIQLKHQKITGNPLPTGDHEN